MAIRGLLKHLKYIFLRWGEAREIIVGASQLCATEVPLLVLVELFQIESA